MKDFGIAVVGFLLILLIVAVKLVVGVLVVNGVLAVLNGYDPTLWEKVLWVVGVGILFGGAPKSDN